MQIERRAFANTAIIGALVFLWFLSPIYRTCAWVSDVTVVRIFKEVSRGGLRVTYYRGLDFGKPVCTRSERVVEKYYDQGRPARKAPRDNFSARWEGILIAPSSAKYSFYLQSDDGSRLFIDDELVIDYWEDGRWNPGKYGGTDLVKGKHRIRIEHCDRGDEAAIRLSWCGGGVKSETILAVPYLLKESEQ